MGRRSLVTAALLAGVSCSSADAPRSPAWSALAPQSVIDGRASHVAVWTGSEVWIWGGDGPSAVALDGARYSPATGAWTAIPAAPFSPAGERPACFTGTELVTWGGESGASAAADGARFDGASWRAIAAPSIAARFGHALVWLGDAGRVIAWGGFDEKGALLADGARYDPSRDAWEPMAGGPLSARSNPGAVSVMGRLVLYGGQCAAGACTDGAAYDPAADRWSPLFSGPAALPELAVTDGTRAIFWGSQYGDENPLLLVDPVSLAVDVRDTTGGPSLRVFAAGWFAGGALTVFGGGAPVSGGNERPLADGASYDVATRTWTTLPDLPGARTRHSITWTGSEAVLFGGTGDKLVPLATGFVFRP